MQGKEETIINNKTALRSAMEEVRVTTECEQIVLRYSQILFSLEICKRYHIGTVPYLIRKVPYLIRNDKGQANWRKPFKKKLFFYIRRKIYLTKKTN